MRYMQIMGGQKLHLVYEPGEGISSDKLIPAGMISAPICGRGFDQDGQFKMIINVPLANVCKRCLRVHTARMANKQSNNPSPSNVDGKGKK